MSHYITSDSMIKVKYFGDNADLTPDLFNDSPVDKATQERDMLAKKPALLQSDIISHADTLIDRALYYLIQANRLLGKHQTYLNSEGYKKADTADYFTNTAGGSKSRSLVNNYRRLEQELTGIRKQLRRYDKLAQSASK